MRVYNFSGSVSGRHQFEGYFIKQDNNEIIGTMSNSKEGGYSFIKGLFIDNKQLIFVEITQKNHVFGYGYKDVQETGFFDVCDWLSGLFSGESAMYDTAIKINIVQSTTKAKILRKKFKRFYNRLNDWNQMYFDDVQDLRTYLNMEY